MNAVILAALSAAIIALASGAFGVGVARLVWAHDLQRARHIAEIRDRTIVSMQKPDVYSHENGSGCL